MSTGGSSARLAGLKATETAGVVRLSVHIQPGASKNGVAGVHGDALKIRVQAPPVEGAANEELVRYLAGVLGLPKSQVELARGQKSRAKLVEIRGLPLAAVLEKLAGALKP